MQIYANLFKINENATSLSFLGRFWFCLFYLIGLGVGFKTSTQNFWNSLLCKYMQIYSNQWKCYFSVISWPILILFVLSDRAWCGLQNFYTELWNSLIMQIYANLFKINEKCYFSVISWPILILFVYLIGLGVGFKLLHIILKFINYAIYANLFKIKEKCYFSVISWPILILLFLSDRAWCGLQNLYTEFWNSIICKFMQIYIQNQWKMLLYFTADFDSVCFIW